MARSHPSCQALTTGECAAPAATFLLARASGNLGCFQPPSSRPSSNPSLQGACSKPFTTRRPLQTLHCKAPFVSSNHPPSSVARNIFISQRVSSARLAVRQRWCRRSRRRSCSWGLGVLWLPPGGCFPSSRAHHFVTVACQVRLPRPARDCKCAAVYLGSESDAQLEVTPQPSQPTTTATAHHCRGQTPPQPTFHPRAGGNARDGGVGVARPGSCQCARGAAAAVGGRCTVPQTAVSFSHRSS